jgi:hypothetical protein
VEHENRRNDMTEQAKEARRAYKREWNRANKDKVKAAQARYWARRAERMKQQGAQSEDDNRDS